MGRALTWPTPAARQNIRQKPPRPDLGPGISQRFKPNGVHTGLDFFWLTADVAGSRLVYGQKGIISRIVLNDPGYGNCIYVQVTDKYEVATAHNSADIRVKVGQQVDTSTIICAMGNTGSLAKEQYHSHQSLIPVGGKFAQGIDPWPYFNGTGVPGTDTVPDPAPAPAANQRQVAGKNAVRRSGPAATPGTALGSPLLAGSIQTPRGFVLTDTMVTAAGGTSPYWLAFDGFYVALACFTDLGTHDLTDLTPQVPEPPVEPTEPTDTGTEPVEPDPTPVEPTPAPTPDTPDTPEEPTMPDLSDAAEAVRNGDYETAAQIITQVNRANPPTSKAGIWGGIALAVAAIATFIVTLFIH